MAAIEVSCGAVHQTVGSDELVGFLLLMGGQDIDPGLSELASLLATRLLDSWDDVGLPLSMVDPLQALSSFSREMDQMLASAMPLALRECRRLLKSEEEVRPMLAYFPGLISQLADLESLMNSVLRLKGAVRLEIRL